MKRIMHIAQAPGGVERYLYTLLKYLDKEKYENILVCSQNYNLEKFSGITSAIECVEMYREINLLNEINAIINIRKIIKKYNPDIVYIHSSKAGATARIANLGLKNVSIYNAHGWAFNMKCSVHKRNIYALIERILAYFCNEIIAISDFEKISALNYKICKEDKIKVIYNGIDFNEHTSSNNLVKVIKSNIPKGAYVVGMVGRLSEQKAPDIFVKAARQIKDVIPNAYFILVGNGEQKNIIQNLISEFELTECTLITGWVDNPLDYIKQFDVAMLLSRWEGFGLVLAEYMLEGKPIVATNVDAIPNLISNRKNGILVEMDDYNAAAKSVIEIHNDSKLQNELILNGIRIVEERFNAKRVAIEHEKLFDSLIN